MAGVMTIDLASLTCRDGDVGFSPTIQTLLAPSAIDMGEGALPQLQSLQPVWASSATSTQLLYYRKKRLLSFLLFLMGVACLGRGYCILKNQSARSVHCLSRHLEHAMSGFRFCS